MDTCSTFHARTTAMSACFKKTNKKPLKRVDLLVCQKVVYILYMFFLNYTFKPICSHGYDAILSF